MMKKAEFLSVHYEAPLNVWWCNFGTYGHLTLRQDEADRARDNGAQVFEYIQSNNLKQTPTEETK